VRAYFERGRWRCRPQIRPGVDGRLNLELNLGDTPEAKREAAAQARAGLIGELLKLLKAAGHDAEMCERVARNLASVEPAEVAAHETMLRKTAGGVFARPEGELVTVQAFGQRWTSGELARKFPDQVRLRGCRHQDAQRLARWLYPVVGTLPLRAVQLRHVEEIAHNLIAQGLRALYRKNILVLIKRLFDLAKYPAKLIESSPFPARDFMPRDEPRALPMLRPSEDLQLMQCTKVMLKFRMFYGLLCRVGFRWSELRRLLWCNVDFEAGYIRFPVHKTMRKMGEKMVPLEPSEVRALLFWRRQNPTEEQVFPALSSSRLLKHLRMAGVEREELYSTTDARRRLSPHHLRGSFVTIALAQGHGESWVMDRTGHLNLGTLTRYRRAGRMAERLGNWTPLDEAIPEIAADRQGSGSCPQGGGNAVRNGLNRSVSQPSAPRNPVSPGPLAAPFEPGGRRGMARGMSQLPRVLEPEVMDDAQEALDYDAMDHGGVNGRFVDDLLALGPDLRAVLDVGTGTARIPLTLLERSPGAQVLGTDLAGSMLDVGRRNVEAAGRGASILLEAADAKALPFGAGAFSTVISNSLIHHIPDPGAVLAELVRVLAAGGVLLVRDLFRPDEDGEARGLVAPLGVPPEAVAATSDRHWTLAWRKPA